MVKLGSPSSLRISDHRGDWGSSGVYWSLDVKDEFLSFCLECSLFLSMNLSGISDGIMNLGMDGVEKLTEARFNISI